MESRRVQHLCGAQVPVEVIVVSVSRRSAALFAPLVLLAAATAAASSVREVTMGRGSGVGKFAFASAGGSVANPVKITVQVTAVPGQRVLVSYTTTCVSAAGVSISNSSQFHATAPVLRHAVFLGHPVVCFVGANAGLSRYGVVRIRLIGYERG